MYTIKDQTIALAGVFQSANLVHQIANTGIVEVSSLESSLNSVIKIDAESTEEVFEGLSGVEEGLHVIKKQMAPQQQPQDLLILRYVLHLVVLANKIRNNKKLLAMIAEGIENVQQQLQHFPITHTNVVSNFAHLYQTVVSPLTPRIMVQGKSLHLNNTDNAAKIRAVLLAGIRAAVLWQQTGGNRWKIMFSRKLYSDMAISLLKELEEYNFGSDKIH